MYAQNWGGRAKRKGRQHWPSATDASAHRSAYWNERLGSRVTNYIPTLHPRPRTLVRLSFSSLFLPPHPAPDPVSHRSRLSFRILKFHKSRRWFLMAVRYTTPAVLLSVFLRPFSSCSSSFCRCNAKNLSAVPPFLLPLTSSPRAPLAILTPLRYYRPSLPPYSAPPPYRMRRDRRYWSAIDLVIPAD